MKDNDSLITPENLSLIVQWIDDDHLLLHNDIDHARRSAVERLFQELVTRIMDHPNDAQCPTHYSLHDLTEQCVKNNCVHFHGNWAFLH